MTMRRVEGIDAAFLAAETAEWQFHVSVVQIVDSANAPGFGFEAVRALLEKRIHLAPQFRWKLVSAPLNVGWSYFVDDPEFDLDHHVHEIALGGAREP